MRRAVIRRRTTETDIALRLALDGRGRYRIHTGIRFLDHMLELVTRHGGFDLQIEAAGDLDVDQHHTVEDLGIALGEAVSAALGNRRGINRAGYFVMPMDETLAVAAKCPTPGTITPVAAVRSSGSAGTKTSAPIAASAFFTDVRLPAP